MRWCRIMLSVDRGQCGWATVTHVLKIEIMWQQGCQSHVRTFFRGLDDIVFSGWRDTWRVPIKSVRVGG